MTQKYEFKEDEFEELIEALIENVEDLNILRCDIVEVDSLIQNNDNSIVKLQEEISKCSDYQQTHKLYKDLKIVADKLEENLDIKENAMQEVERLNQMIKFTKMAMKRMYVSSKTRVCDADQDSELPRPTLLNLNLNLSDSSPDPEGGPMLSSHRDRRNLMEEIRKRDEQIASLTQTLKNLSRETEMNFKKKLPHEEQKENVSINTKLD